MKVRYGLRMTVKSDFKEEVKSRIHEQAIRTCLDLKHKGYKVDEQSLEITDLPGEDGFQRKEYTILVEEHPKV